MKILLTGGSGFLGSLILKTLAESNEIFTLSRKNSHYNFNLNVDVPVFNQKFDIIIHAAGKAHSLPISDDEKNEFYQTNVTGTLNLLNALSNNSIPDKFIFISSVSVYGLIKGENINEESPLLASDPYGKSKIEAELIIKKWCLDHNVICTILRLPLVVGTNPPGNLGSMIRGIKKGYYFNIGGGAARKSMVLASDIARYSLKIAEMGGTYNLTDGIHPTFENLSKKICVLLNKPAVPNLPKYLAIILAKIGDFFGDSFPFNTNKFLKITSTLTFDDSKAKISFDWKPTPVLEGIKLKDDE